MSENTIDFKEIWNKLSAIDITKLTKKKKVEKKEYGYIPWAVAWAEVVKVYPDSTHEILCDDTGFPCFIKDSIGAFCKTSITICGHTRKMDLPVLNFANKAMKADAYTYSTKYSGEKSVSPLNSFDINTTKWRCLVKNLSIFGFGISLFADLDWESQEDEENEIAWETARKRKLGRGKNEDKTWIELSGQSLLFYTDKVKNKFYSEWYATRAQKEIDWRAGGQEDGDFESKPDILKNMRLDVQASADDILKTKYNKEIQYGDYCRLIKEAKDEATLITLGARIKTIDVLVKAFKKGNVDAEGYKKYLIKISIADNGVLYKLGTELHTLSPEAKENRDVLEHYWNEIEDLHKELGYSDIPNLAMNSMNKHLGTKDMHSITNITRLKEYEEYLRLKLKEHKNKPAKVEEKIEKIEPIIG